MRDRARFIEDYDDNIDQARLDLGKFFRIPRDGASFPGDLGRLGLGRRSLMPTATLGRAHQDQRLNHDPGVGRRSHLASIAEPRKEQST